MLQPPPRQADFGREVVDPDRRLQVGAHLVHRLLELADIDRRQPLAGMDLCRIAHRRQHVADQLHHLRAHIGAAKGPAIRAFEQMVRGERHRRMGDRHAARGQFGDAGQEVSQIVRKLGRVDAGGLAEAPAFDRDGKPAQMLAGFVQRLDRAAFVQAVDGAEAAAHRIGGSGAARVGEGDDAVDHDRHDEMVGHVMAARRGHRRDHVGDNHAEARAELVELPPAARDVDVIIVAEAGFPHRLGPAVMHRCEHGHRVVQTVIHLLDVLDAPLHRHPRAKLGIGHVLSPTARPGNPIRVAIRLCRRCHHAGGTLLHIVAESTITT